MEDAGITTFCEEVMNELHTGLSTGSGYVWGVREKWQQRSQNKNLISKFSKSSLDLTLHNLQKSHSSSTTIFRNIIFRKEISE
jgi:hypothetical protein